MSVNLNTSRGTNSNVNIGASSKTITKQSKWTDLFKDKRVLGGLMAATSLTGYLVARAGSVENISQSSNSLLNVAVGAALISVCTIANECFKFKPKANSGIKNKELIENLIKNFLDTGSLKSYQNYANQLQKDFPVFLSVIEKTHSETPYNQEEISRLFSNFFISKITNPIHIEMLRNCINSDTPLNQMIREAVTQACGFEITHASGKFERLIFREIVDKSLLLKNIMKNPFSHFIFTKAASETGFGLQAYTRLSYDLVMDLFEKRIEQNDENGLLTLLRNFLKDKLLVRQLEETKIPFNHEASRLISKVLNREAFYSMKNDDLYLDHLSEEKYYEKLENKFINYANDNLSIVLDSLYRFDEMQILTQENVSLIFTEKFFQQLCDDNIAKLKEHLNKDTNLNAMIFFAVKENYRKAMETDAQGDLVNYVKLLGEESTRISDFAHKSSVESNLECNMRYESHAEGLNLENPLNQQSNVVNENHDGIEEGSDRIAIQLY